MELQYDESELNRLLALNREDDITHEELARLNYLLELRGLAIDGQYQHQWAAA